MLVLLFKLQGPIGLEGLKGEPVFIMLMFILEIYECKMFELMAS